MADPTPPHAHRSQVPGPIPSSGDPDGTLPEGRREFLKGALTGGAVAALGGLGAGALPGAAAAADGPQVPNGAPHKYHYVPVTDKTVHWGYFSRSLPPVVE